MKTGDKAQLKTGGPCMTVEDVNEDGVTIICAWFSKDDHRRGTFHKDMLQDCAPPPPPPQLTRAKKPYE